MKLSVVVCTYNRAEYLRRMLRSFYEQDGLAEIGFELLVVDNNSTDATPEVLREFDGRPGFRSFVEGDQGLSHARNRGLHEAAGEHIAYLDDDVLLSANWMRDLLQCFEETGAEVVGGKSLLRFEETPPPWFGKEIGKLVSEVDLGEERIDAGDGRRLYGLNVAYCTERLREIGGFDATLGRTGEKLLSGEDLRANAAIVASGGKAIYEPKALVYHCIPPERTAWPYLLRLAESGARTRAGLDRRLGIFAIIPGVAITSAKLLYLVSVQLLSIGSEPDSEALRARAIAIYRLKKLLYCYLARE